MRLPPSIFGMTNSVPQSATMRSRTLCRTLRRMLAGAAVVSGLFTPTAQAGLVVYGTRFALAAPASTLGITVQNTGDAPFLVKSQVRPDTRETASASLSDPAVTHEDKQPFVIIPPLFTLGAGQSNQLRLVCLECEKLPANRESLYWLSISAIPAGKAPPNSVQLAIRSSFKVFYRPEGLPGKADIAYQQLQWQRQKAQVTVRNPTPYYVTLFQMQVNGERVNDAGMVAPFSTYTQSWCPETGNCTLQWRTLDDFSGLRPAWVVSPGGVEHRGQAVRPN